MKHLHKFASVLLALAMALSLMVPAFASGTPATGDATITINNATVGHTYDAYQIFKGDLATSDGEDVLSNVEWGSGVVDEATALAAAKSVTGLENAGNAAEVAAILASGYETGETDEQGKPVIKQVDAAAFAQAMGAAGVLSDTKYSSAMVGADDTSATISCNGNYGYYLIKDNAATPGTPDNTADAVSVFMLQVVGPTEVNSKVGTPSPDKKIVEDGKKVNVSDYNIGDTVTFELTATLGGNYDKYKKYELTFHDTLSKGLKFAKIESVTVAGTSVSDYASNSGIVITTPEADATGETQLTIKFTDLKTSFPELKTGETIVITYTATVTPDAVTGNPGNPNKMHLEFSNNPNDDGEGETDTTPDKEVLVFTYELDNNKVDGQDEDIKLAGAEFKLQANDGEHEGKWVTVDENGKVAGWVDDEASASTLTSDEDGLFKVIGLDAGKYTLKETKAPAGYNLPSPATTEITITAKFKNIKDENGTAGDQEVLEYLNISVGDEVVDPEKAGNGNVATGTVETTIKNNKGATLPETGGIGTTIFYTVGGILVAGAVILLVTKKRMSAEK